MVQLFLEKQNCCGCTACKNICPKSAISMAPDEEGFLYPKIEQSRCVECGLCKKTCAFQNGWEAAESYEKPEVYAAKHKDVKIRLKSTSGGVFTALSDVVLESGGAVFGAMLDSNRRVVHRKAETKEERDRFRGAKYVQSDVKNVFPEIRELLEQNRYVLFTGTPCQAAGLKSYLKGTNLEKLYLCDLICHGTSSPGLWEQHVRLLEKKNHSEIKNFYFRPKTRGWHEHHELCVFQNGKSDDRSYLSQAHKNLLFSNLTMRPSCHHCVYVSTRRPSDITIGDFWGIEQCMPDFDDDKGVSFVLINTEKGRRLFDRAREYLDCRTAKIDDTRQPQLYYPTPLSPVRQKFWKDYFSRGYRYVVKKYAGCGIKSAMRRGIIKILKKSGLMKIMKRFLGLV